jgi:hypothetical protein
MTPQALVERWQGSITLVTLATWRSRKLGPRYIKIGGRVLYPLDGVEEWEAKRTFNRA